MASSKSEFDMNPYEVLGLEKDCTQAQVVKAYKKAALKWHPDKNPDKKEFAEDMFKKISTALGILTDAAAKAAYDQLEASKSARTVYVQRRQKTESDHRRKLREELEKKEAGALNAQQEVEKARRNLEKEIDRLRKEGSKLVQREMENIDREVHRKGDFASKIQSSSQFPSESDCSARLKVKWKRGTDNGYTEPKLRSIFEKFGEVTTLVLSSSGKGTAIVEFSKARDALNAENEVGDPSNSFTVSWLSPRPDPTVSHSMPNRTSSAPQLTRQQGSFTSATEFADFEASILASMVGAGAKRKADAASSKFDDL